jgi:glycine C-acetyltransferase
VAATLAALDLIEGSGDLRDRLRENTERFRGRMAAEGFEIVAGDHPIVPVMIGDAVAAGRLAEEVQRHGVYVVAFSYPVVPQGQARIRAQMSAAHTTADVDRAVEAFLAARAALGLLPVRLQSDGSDARSP